MPNVVVNNFTSQKPLVATGNTGAQVLAVIPAARVFLKAPDSITAAPVSTYAAYSFKTLGVTPSGWSDAGIMDAPAKLMYNKNIAKVQTGLDKVTRKTYSASKDATLEFSLWQLDDYLLTQLGFSGSVATAGSAMNFMIGKEDVLQTALLCVYVNKLDGKEFHLYHPSASLNCQFDYAGDKLVVKATADLTAFTGAGDTVESLYAWNVFA
jgi:hypothetical protein